MDDDLPSRWRRLQERILGAHPSPHRSADEVFRELRKRLIRACEDDILVNSPEDIFRDLKRTAPPKRLKLNDAISIVGGEKNFDRDPAKRHFLRDDQAWFDFVVTLRDEEGHVVVLAYDFEIRFPDSSVPRGLRFLRFDLNPPGHPNETHGVRSHLHCDSDDYSAPSAVFDPLELLDLFLYSLRPRDPDRRRR